MAFDRGLAKGAAVQRQRVMKHFREVLAVSVAVLALAPVASAATVSVREVSDQFVAYYVAARGEINDVLVAPVG